MPIQAVANAPTLVSGVKSATCIDGSISTHIQRRSKVVSKPIAEQNNKPRTTVLRNPIAFMLGPYAPWNFSGYLFRVFPAGSSSGWYGVSFKREKKHASALAT